jgi:hypothetical protein
LHADGGYVRNVFLFILSLSNNSKTTKRQEKHEPPIQKIKAFLSSEDAHVFNHFSLQCGPFDGKL